MATVLNQEALQQELKKRRICRFCLSQTHGKLTNIYQRDTRIKSSAPLPIQIMAIGSIEVFSNDGMPGFVCSDCTSIFEFSYQFKQMCKKADTLLRQYPLIGKWPEPLEKPLLDGLAQSQNVLNRIQQRPQSTQIRVQQTNQIIKSQDSPVYAKKILNSTPVQDPVPPQPIRTKVEQVDEDEAIFLTKIENDDEISFDDIQQLVANDDEEVQDVEFLDTEMDNLPMVVVSSGNKSKPKLLNKSSVRILNKEANSNMEPRLSIPKIKQSYDGNTEIVAEILNYNEPYENESDPKNAEVIETNVYPCPHCERSFPLLQLRDLHMKNHTRDRKFPCEECDKCFFSKYDLQRHSFTHNGEKPFKCTACDKAFSRSSLLQRHEKGHTDIPKYICITCEKPFISKEAMEKHAERHKINRPFQCKLCNKTFAFKQGLERHEVIHSRQQPYPCQYCDQSFSTTTKLARHLTAHAGQRPYPCKFCKKSYLLSHHLTRHMRSHKNMLDGSTIISFMCSCCDASFESRDELIRHSTTHATAQNLSCPLCKERFDNIEELTSHIRDHSDGEAYACEFCDLIFMTPDKLQFHTDSDHAQEMEVYYEDDRAQADLKHQQANQHNISDDEQQQHEIDEFLIEDVSEYNQKIRIKDEKSSPKIINQIIIQSGPEADDNSSLLVPLKQRKLENNRKVVAESPKPKLLQKSPQLRRKIPVTTPVREKNQPTIQSSLLRQPRNAAVAKTPTNNTNVLKSEVFKSPPNATNAVGNQSVSEVKIGEKKVKIQKIRVTKAQAEAMAKEGRIKMKDGQMILSKDRRSM